MKARLPELYDLAIGNPPFSDRTVRADDPGGELRLSLHDYFIARSVERLRPGGLAAFVTSRWTMRVNIASSYNRKDNRGEWVERTRWNEVTVFGESSQSQGRPPCATVLICRP